jgi:hypothetical protein
VLSPIYAQSGADPGDEATVLWNRLLKQYVATNGMVDYTAWKIDPLMDKTLELFSNQNPNSSWSDNEVKAFWINVYNAFTVKLILDNYPLKSINDLDKPWDTIFITVSGKRYSLNDIEHEILRKRFKDPRIHFAVNCASFSCPKLLNAAYVAEKLDAQLSQQAKEFVNDKSRNLISPNQVKISKLFDWYKSDFTTRGNVIDYLNKYASVKIASNAELSYMDYDWSLNNK